MSLSKSSRQIVETAKKWILVKHFKGEPKPSDLKLVEEKLPPIKDGEFLAEAEYLSVDPYMRPYSARYPVNTTMIGSQIVKIIESKNSAFPVGKKIIAYLGWRSHTVVDMENLHNTGITNFKPHILPDIGDLPSSLGLGTLGMPGNTAYFGLLEICKPKAGETLVVSGAAGAVGAHVGQIGKILGLKVIGIAGSDEKCQWLTKELGFDHAINYKTKKIAAELKNVGGDISSTILYQMNDYGRVSVCGAIANYNAEVIPKCVPVQPALVFSQLKMEGFLVGRWANRWNEGVQQNLKWIKEGKLVYRETVTNGFDNMFNAFVGMLRGENIGKAIVKV